MQELLKLIKKRNKTHLIFDFDATIFLLELPWDEWKTKVKAELEKIDSTCPFWKDWSAQSVSYAELQNYFLLHHRAATEPFLRSFSSEFEATRLKGVSINQDLLDFVRTPRKEGANYLWSSNSRRVIDKILNIYDLTSCFSSIVTRDNVPFLKPNPAGFELIHDNVRPKEHYLMIGDSQADAGAAAGAGIDFIKVDYFSAGL